MAGHFGIPADILLELSRMLLRLEIENFYSIRDRHVFDLRVPRTTPDDERFLLVNDEGSRVPAVVAILGANASGKTSVLRALAFLEDFIEDSFTDYDPDDHIALDAFAAPGYEHGVTSLAVEFCPSPLLEEDIVCRYELDVQHLSGSNYVKREKFSQSTDGEKFTPLFELHRGDDGVATIRAAKEFDLGPKDPRRSVRPNVSLVSSLIQFNHGPAKRVSRLLAESFLSNLYVAKFTWPVDSVTKLLQRDELMLNKLNQVIRSIDVGIESISFMEVNGNTIPVFKHQGLTGVRTLDYESQGTQSFYCLFPLLAMSLGSGRTAVLDELDSDLHPALVSEIIRWYCDPNENVTGAQLIMTCNSPTVLHDMEKEEVWLAEKDSKGASSIIPLSSMAGVRRDANLYSKYLSGSFGAVPRFG